MANSDIARSFFETFTRFMKGDAKAKELRQYLATDVDLTLPGGGSGGPETAGVVASAYGSVNQPTVNNGSGDPLYYPGVPTGADNAMRSLKSFRSDIDTQKIVERHLIGGGKGLANNNPFGEPEYVDNQVAILSDIFAKDKKNDNGFRLDSAAFIGIDDNGKINSFDLQFDSYVMSQALADATPLIANPDMDKAMRGNYDTVISPSDTEGATLNYFGTFATAVPPDPAQLDVLTGVLTDNARAKFQGDPRYQLSARNKIKPGINHYLGVQKDSWVQSISEVFAMEQLFSGNGVSVAKYNEQRISAGPGFKERTGFPSLGRIVQIPASITTYIANTEQGYRTSGTEGLFDTVPIMTATYGSTPFPLPTKNYVGPLDL